MKTHNAKRFLIAGVLLAVAVTAGNVAQAQSCNVEWTNKAGDNSWSTAGNWSTNHVPGPTSDVCILTGIADASLTPSISIHSLQIGNNNVTLYLGSGTVSIATSVDSEGFIDILGAAKVSIGTTLTSSGQITTAGATISAASVDIQSGPVIGCGTFESSVTNNGYIYPSGAPPNGGLTVTGNYTQTANGELSEQWGSRLVVNGNVTLSGYFSVGVSYHHLPSPGSTYTALTAGSLGGKFTHVTIEDGGSVKYTNDSVVVTFQ